MSRRGDRLRRNARRRRLTHRLLALVGTFVIVTAVIVFAVSRGGAEPAPEAGSTEEPPPSETPTPTEESDPLEQLIEESGDPNGCAVTFAGEAISADPAVHSEGALFSPLPIPTRDDAVFAGWYASPEAAAQRDRTQRLNIADRVACEERRLELHGAWMTPDEVAAEDVGVPVLMYHQFTDLPEGVDDPLRLNWAYIGDFEQHMAYLAEEDFYLPSWRELSAFIDGELFLPHGSVIVTDDDAHASWFDLAVPVLDEHEILATSFVITKWRSEGTPSPYVLQRSHTHDMHDPGANGDGRMVNWPSADIAADLEQSAEILGAKEVVAYPFGHYDETAKQGTRDAGFELGLTIDDGVVRAGADKLALPRVRINYGMTVDDLIARVG